MASRIPSVRTSGEPRAVLVVGYGFPGDADEDGPQDCPDVPPPEPCLIRVALVSPVRFTGGDAGA